MSFDYQAAAVWLDDLEGSVTPGAAYAMCGGCADRLTPPIGWSLTDRREATQLFAHVEVA